MKKIAIAAIAIWEMICLFLMAIARSTHDSVGIFVFLALAPFIAVLIHKAADKPKQTKYRKNSIETKPEIPQPGKSISVSEFTAIQIETYNRQFKESYDLIMNSKNTETVLRRLSFIDKVYVDLKRTSGANKSWSYYQKLYETINNDRETIINNAIKRGYEAELSKASDLSTNSGRINHMKNYIDKVMQLKDLPDSCKAYADTLFDNIEQDLQLSKEDGCTYIKKQLSQMKADGIEKYEFLATLDTETCPVCGALDKKIFSVSQAKIGVNCPPMHDGCRCVIIEYFDDEFSSGSTRAARDPKTGKTIYVPDISYTEWKKYTDNN